MDKVLVVGASGLLGRYLFRELSGDYRLVLTYCSAQPPYPGGDWEKMDITRPDEVNGLMRRVGLDVVINAAAMTNVDQCEREPEQATSVNADGPGHLARAAAKAGAFLVQVSTDYVFDGRRGLYTEDDPTGPVNVYGASKLGGEEAVRAYCPGHLICRTSVLYGWADKPNFATWLLAGLRQGKEMPVVTDQRNSPTYAADLAAQIRALAEAGRRGTYHTCGAEAVDRMEFARRLARAFGLDASRLKPVQTCDLRLLAPRPADSSLNISKVSRFKRPQPIGESLDAMRAEEHE